MIDEGWEYSLAFIEFKLSEQTTLEERMKMSSEELCAWKLKEKEREQMFLVKWREDKSIKQEERRKQEAERFERDQNILKMWRSRLNEPAWKLKDAIIWIVESEEWLDRIRRRAHSSEEYIIGFRKVVDFWINENEISSFEDEGNSCVIPLEFLACCDLKNIILPKACYAFVEEKRKHASLEAISRSVKHKLPKTMRSLKIKKKRHDRVQNERFLEIVKQECNNEPPSSYKELLQRSSINSCLKSMTDAKGSHKQLTDKYVKRLISPYVSKEAKRPGCRPKAS